jgi:amino acid adenylation domain-containing protein
MVADVQTLTHQKIAADNVAGMFAARAAEHPERTAATCAGIDITYGGLDAVSGSVARFLTGLGAVAEEPVGVFMDRGIDAIAAIVGIVRAGCAYVPLDSRAPAARLATVVEECGIVRVLVDSAARAETLRGLPGGGLDVIAFDDIPAGLDPYSADVDPGQLAYVVFTSGSSGVPNGVEIAHRDLAAFVLDPCWGESLDQRVLLHSPLNFDASVFEMWMPLLRGGCVVVAPPGGDDVGALRRVIAEQGVTCTFITTSLFNVMAEEYPDAFASMRQVWMGGEAASPAAVRRTLAACGSASVVNVYGPTEATIFALYHVVPDEVGGSVPIGTEMAGVGAYVLDDDLRAVPDGSEGELCLGGVGVARGYRGRRALTAERFVPDPFAGGGERMYRTGDIVRRRADGLLEFVGRRDSQVKVRGYRIELGEIEERLTARDDVAGAVAVVREDRRGDKTIVAYAVPRRNTPAAAATADQWEQQLLEHLGGQLPPYMVPTRCVVLDALPLNPNGKLDARALPAPARAAGGALPRTSDEALLCQVFADVLGTDAVGVDDDFFALGGHSLLAVRVAARIEAATGRRLNAAELFNAPTAAALAARLEGVADAAGSGRMEPAQGPPPERIPLSYEQRRLWIVNQVEGEASTAYHIPVLFTLLREPDVGALRAALADVIERHESLRTVFSNDEDDADGGHQRVLGPGEWTVDLECVDCPSDDLDAAVERAVREPFDLTRLPPIRARILRGPERSLLLLVVHHICADGWSLTPLSRDLGRAYAARVRGTEPGLPPLPVQYRDYVRWQRELLGDREGAQNPVLGEQLAYWRERLAGAPQQLTLPTDRPRPALPSHRGSVVCATIPADLRRQLEELARSAKTTLFTVLHAGLAALLTRLGAGEDVVVGSPVAGRSDRALDDLVGFFVNTVVLRTDTSGDPGFAGLLGRVKAAWLGAYAHQDVPFDLLVEHLNPPRSLAGHPVFQVGLSLLNTSDAELRIGPLTGDWTLADAGSAKFDLSFTVIPRFAGPGVPDGLDLMVEYAADLFDRITAQRVADRLVLLLRDAVADPDRPIGSLRVVTDQEIAGQLAAHVGLGPLPATLAEAFRAQLASRADQIAVIDGTVELDYRDLDERSERLARHLADCGNGPESCVAFLLDHSADAVVAVLGTVKAGAAYVPLDSRIPPARLAAMLAQCRVRTVLVDTAERAEFIRTFAEPGTGVTLIGDALRAGADSGAVPAGPAHGLQLAYVMFTSGSTGVPKGVAVTHQDVIGLCADGVWTDEVAQRVVLHSPLGFDASTLEIWLPLLRGGRIVVAPVDEGVAGLYRVIVDAGVTMAFMTAQLFNVVAAEHPDVFARLRQVWSGGEEASTTAFARAAEAAGPGGVVHTYGPTETTTFATFHTLEHAEPHCVPLGHAMDGVRAYVVDAAGNLAGDGMAGELFIGGVGVARGYLRQPGPTAERFLPDPFGAPGSRMYRTGDVFRRRSDGLLEFSGRVDRQMKIRGFRIEPREIETLLTADPEVGRAAVVARDDPALGKMLVAYVVPASGPQELETMPGRLRDRLREQLPAYMLPHAIVPVPALPLTLNGKLDVAALPAPVLRSASRPPASDRERALCALFAEMLGRPTVGVDDGFFELGGHSLLAVRLVGRLRSEFGVDLPVKEFFRLSTVAGLAAALDEEAAGRSAAAGTWEPADRPMARTTSPDQPVPLAPAQERIWFLDQLNPGRSDYNVPVARRLAGPLDPERLRTALSALADRHDILRTRYEAPEGEPYQTVVAAWESPTVFVDHSGEPGPRALEAARRTLAGQAALPFDLEAAPPVRYVLVRLDDDDHVLAMVIHHIATDGWSGQILWHDLAALYRDGASARLPELAVRYADFAQWQRGRLDGRQCTEDVGYWRSRLAGLAPAELPADRPRPPRQSGRGAQVDFDLPQRLYRPVHELSRRAGATPFMTLLTVFQVLVAQVTGSRQVAVGSPVAGRAWPELEPLAGFFVNSVVLRAAVEPGAAFLDLLARTRQSAAEAYSHSAMPFDRLVDKLRPQRDLSRNPLFQLSFALFDLDPAAEAADWGPELSAREHPIPVSSAKFDFELALADRGDRFAGAAYFTTDLFDTATVRRYLDQYTGLLEAVLDRPDAAPAPPSGCP